VISVGNLSVGGSGKTPVAGRVAEILRDAGCPVAVLSRGYRGSFRGDALVVSDGERVTATAAEAGDEPVMLARALPGVVVAVGPRRDQVGRAVEARFGRRVHVLDDGFQHLRLFRDLDVLCLAERDLEDRPLPAGRLREFPSAASAADVVLVSRRPGDEAGREGGERSFAWWPEPAGFATAAGIETTAPRRPYLVAGIARPERFAASAQAVCPGWTGSWFFPDHHAFTASEAHAVGERARAAGADGLLTTAKDAERLPAEAAGLPVVILRIRVVVEDEPRLRALLLRAAGVAA
jgi:tetraacyldisaccharide 4'-kinase